MPKINRQLEKSKAILISRNIMPNRMILILGTMLLTSLANAQRSPAESDEDLIQLLQTKKCGECRLMDSDLMHSDLRESDLNGAFLQRANLNQVNLDGANLRNANLSFTSLRGASLRGTDLRGSRLYGTDLRNADLSGAQLEPNALEESYWQGAKGIDPKIHSHATLHNAGVEAAQTNLWRDAERLFSDAIFRNPTEPLSWVARGICRGQLGNNNKAINDLMYAADLFEQEGDLVKAEQLRNASLLLTNDDKESSAQGNGLGSAVLNGTLSILQQLAPMALRALTPFIP